MNYKKYLKDFEKILINELSLTNPLIKINKNTILYKKFKINQNDNGHWDLSRANGDLVHTFKLKSAAIVAAKYYSELKYKHVEELKSLDFEYWSSHIDVIFFKQRVRESVDSHSKDIFLSKLSYASSKANNLKHLIINRLNVKI